MDLTRWRASPLYPLVTSIMLGPDVPYKSMLTAVLHTTTSDYTIYKVLSENIVRDYINSMMDTVHVKIKMPLGDYVYLVYPNKENLEMTITKTPLTSIGDGVDPSAAKESIRYKCLFDPSNPTFTMSDVSSFAQNTMNNARMVDVSFFLVDRNAEPLRVKQTQGIFRGVKAKDFITAVLISEAQQILVDGKPVILGLDMDAPDNQAVSSQVIMRSGTHLCEVPTMFQENFGGVYKYGIGTYVQRYNNATPLWFVYPLYNFNRFDDGKARNTITFYSAPQQFYKNIERTYRVNGGSVEAVITTEKSQKDPSDTSQMNRGVGIRYMDPGAIMKKPVLIGNDGSPMAARANLNNEVNYFQRADGLQYAPVNMNAKSNLYHEISKVSERQATMLHFAWENSDESLIYPGMPAKFCYMENDVYCEVKGTIAAVQANRTRHGPTGDIDRMSTKCIIALATELNPTLPVYDTEQSLDPNSNQNN